MDKTGRNNPCPCGSGKKYKKCCFDKKPREQTIIVASPERLYGFHYDKERMEFTGLTLDDPRTVLYLVMDAEKAGFLVPLQMILPGMGSMEFMKEELRND